jgi:hypothetical protein
MIEINLLKDDRADDTCMPSHVYHFYCRRCDDWHPWGRCEAQGDRTEPDTPKPERRGWRLRTLQEFLGSG